MQVALGDNLVGRFSVEGGHSLDGGRVGDDEGEGVKSSLTHPPPEEGEIEGWRDSIEAYLRDSQA